MTSAISCTHCGAMMVPQWDGRLYQCPYCRTQVQVAIGADQIAAGMAADLSDVDGFLARLAATLQEGFSERAQVRVEGGFVHGIEIDLETDRYVVHREGPRAVASHKKMVRGVALKTKQLPLDEWYARLTESLAAWANTSARAAWVLGKIGGPRR
jgi:hypothetical protein